MSARTIDLSNYPRRAHFDYFRAMAYPYVGLTVSVDVTALAQDAKDEGQSFFLRMLYAIGRAANDTPSFRQRIQGAGIVEYDFCPTSHTVLKENGTYAYCEADSRLPLPEFLTQTARRQKEAARAGSIQEESDPQSLLFLSCLPWLSYTGLVQPVPSPADSNPRITWGRYQPQDGKLLLPVSVLAHHALVDGKQLADFYQALDRQLGR